MSVTRIGAVWMAVGILVGFLAGLAMPTATAEQNLVAHSASSTGRIQVTSAQRINIKPQPINVVVLQDVQTGRSYLVVVGGQVTPLDETALSQEKP